MTGVLGTAGRKGHRYGLATDRRRKLSERHLGLESAAKLPGRSHSRPAGERLEDTGRNLLGLTQFFCFQREGCLR